MILLTKKLLHLLNSLKVMHPMKSPAEDKDKENKKQLRNLPTRKRTDIDEGQGRVMAHQVCKLNTNK